ncbi:UNKNOWN [Stylonychia lemnae]|uniref:Uncharacterized protein n=1 Tax=Stylonychia lemnae TaxID=5949 RepID=A0A078A1A1_STYLE|nr:UNKNOWN [Stylonychia lemnae]|eukprot:CDW76031.1 UNKNOWN [Stylonychia lemnae]
MGCCSTKEDPNLYKQSNANMINNPDYCCAYVKKDKIKSLLMRQSKTQDDSQLISKLMTQINSEIDLGLLLTQIKEVQQQQNQQNNLKSMEDSNKNEEFDYIMERRKSISQKQKHLLTQSSSSSKRNKKLSLRSIHDETTHTINHTTFPNDEQIEPIEKIDEGIQTDNVEIRDPDDNIIKIQIQPIIQASTGEQAFIVMRDLEEDTSLLREQVNSQSSVTIIPSSNEGKKLPEIMISPLIDMDNQLQIAQNQQHQHMQQRKFESFNFTNQKLVDAGQVVQPLQHNSRTELMQYMSMRNQHKYQQQQYQNNMQRMNPMFNGNANPDNRNNNANSSGSSNQYQQQFDKIKSLRRSVHVGANNYYNNSDARGVINDNMLHTQRYQSNKHQYFQLNGNEQIITTLGSTGGIGPKIAGDTYHHYLDYSTGQQPINMRQKSLNGPISRHHTQSSPLTNFQVENITTSTVASLLPHNQNYQQIFERSIRSSSLESSKNFQNKI